MYLSDKSTYKILTQYEKRHCFALTGNGFNCKLIFADKNFVTSMMLYSELNERNKVNFLMLTTFHYSIKIDISKILMLYFFD